MTVKRNSQKLPGVSLKRVSLDISTNTVSLDVERSGSLQTPSLCNVYVAFPVYFSAGETTKTLSVSSTGDAAFTAADAFGVYLADAENAQFDYTATQIETIVPEIVTITVSSISAATVIEGGTAQHTVVLTGNTIIPQTFAFGIVPISASALDYSQSPTFSQGVTFNQGAGLITVPAGVSQFIVSLPTVDDTIEELAETYTIQVGGIGQVSTITDNDAPPATLDALSKIAIYEAPYAHLTAPQRTAIAGNGGYAAFAVSRDSVSQNTYRVYRSATENGTYAQVLTGQAFAPSADLIGLIGYKHDTLAFENEFNWPATITANTVGLLQDTSGQQEFSLINGWSTHTVAGVTAKFLDNMRTAIYHSLPVQVESYDTARMYLLSNSIIIDPTIIAQGATVYYKVVPADAQDVELALSSVLPIAFTATGVANKPYGPRNVAIVSGDAAPTNIDDYTTFPSVALPVGNLHVYLGNSSRLDEATPSGFYYPNTTKETGVEYFVDVIGRNDEIVRTLTATNGVASYGITQRNIDGDLDPVRLVAYAVKSAIRSPELIVDVSINHRESPDLFSVTSALSGSSVQVTVTMTKSYFNPYALSFDITGTAKAAGNVGEITANNGVIIDQGLFLQIPPNTPTFIVTIPTSNASGQTVIATFGRPEFNDVMSTSQTISGGAPVNVTISENTGATFNGVQDARMRETNPTNNYSTFNEIQAVSWFAGDITTSLIRFTGLSNIPSGATITAATVRFWLIQNSNTPTRVVELKRCLRAWDIAQVTANEYSTGNAWQSVCALGANDISAAASVSMQQGAEGNFMDLTSAQLIADVQAFVSGSQANNGWLFALQDLFTHDQKFSNCASSEGADGQRPALIVTYTV